MGLPPQVRGAPAILVTSHRSGRLTPAGAGSTFGSARVTAAAQAYPRRCGEHSAVKPRTDILDGLPPQVRGAPVQRSYRCRRPGLTPAGAGSTGLSQPAASKQWAYPRRCGEHLVVRVIKVPNPGLPPQVRGAPNCEGVEKEAGGLTPAGAGSTTSRSRRRRCLSAYPRRCGEHHQPAAHRRTYRGLPPQVRGARSGRWSSRARPGLTPAGAGSTVPDSVPNWHE